MITLYCFGRGPGLPDFSPFVIKTMLLLKLAGLDYVEDRSGLQRAPKGKLPYIDDDGVIVADSTFIRWHIEKTRGIDLDRGLTAEQRAIAWAAEKMCEDHLYWIGVRGRWLDDANFARGPARFFDRAPAFARPLLRHVVRGRIRKALYAQGTGRYTDEEVTQLGIRDGETLATLLGDKPYFFGEEPCGADATFFAFIAATLAPNWESPLRAAAEKAPNLVAYRDRILKTYFPDIAEARA
ncbi:glutathione S-transferase family protein [Methylocystis bryophila]|uniref:Glutathione S-transferase n=1 Tax=Methylocystis bryophila TaxID=655015 RepID=A0A1W6MTX4_9HYPH|nr:glutathione S-transferase family protein [Methylocystis bryophila]ARN80939.1 glutathione S-transferase [Methylocystis bryophila]BDV36841.1 glutathione S-transferase [Methylocystis bryophila]